MIMFFGWKKRFEEADNRCLKLESECGGWKRTVKSLEDNILTLEAKDRGLEEVILRLEKEKLQHAD